MKLFGLLVAAKVVMLLSGCGFGTDTGNPAAPNFGGGQGPKTFVGALVEFSCETITNCNSDLPMNVCREGLLAQSNVNEKIGLDKNAYSSLDEILQAEIKEEIIPDRDDGTECLLDLTELSCADSEVIDSYQPKFKNPFKFYHKMIPESCTSVFMNFREVSK